MNTKKTLLLTPLLLLALPCAPVQAWGSVRVGVGIGLGVPFYPYYYRPYAYPVYVAPAPVVIAPQTVYVAPQPQPLYIQTAPGVFQMVSPGGAQTTLVSPQATQQTSTYYQAPAPAPVPNLPPPRPIPVTTVN